MNSQAQNNSQDSTDEEVCSVCSLLVKKIYSKVACKYTVFSKKKKKSWKQVPICQTDKSNFIKASQDPSSMTATDLI